MILSGHCISFFIDLTLDETSFQLVDHVTKMETEDFYKDPKDKLEKVYFEEIKELLKKVAEKVFPNSVWRTMHKAP